MQASTDTSSNIETIETSTVNISLFNLIPLKKVTVNVIPSTTVIPIGSTVGLKLYTNGVLVVGMSEIEGSKPYEKCNIKEGDMIISIEETAITCTADLVETVNTSNGNELDLTYVRDGKEYYTSITPTKTTSNEYKLGLWVRDAAAGVGTITYYEPSTGNFGALGHGIVDIDTEDLISIANGEIVSTNILSIIKGERGNPGEIRGTISGQSSIGEVFKNTNFGIYGRLNNLDSLNINYENEMEVAPRNEIKTGPAKIICSLENGVKEEYDIEIKKIYKNNNSDNKSMLIEVTDNDLLDLTGGIIQGMSGCPIIQNNKFIGAITHVLVNNPKQGYAIFGDLMIKQTRQID
ncbi:MAG: SpoIVB peptidase [Lachnospiraceae bacterium]|nr:SpoIVB peptidase [Lachnospiraceae bacterium]